MLSLFSFVVVFKWVSEHVTETIIGVVVFIYLISLILRRKRAVNRSRATVPVADPRPAPAPVSSPVQSFDPSPVVSFPDTYMEKNRAYFYENVKIVSVPGGVGHVVPGNPLSFSCSESSVDIFQGVNRIGTMVENRLAGMVRDWQKAGDPILAYVTHYSDDGQDASIGLAFYQDLVARFLKKNPGARSYKLSGKPDDLAFGYVPGSRCSVESDFDDPEKYNVLFEGSFLGRLPSSALHYVEENGYSPEDLYVIIASVDYDDEKDRDVISVYIS